MKYNHFIVALLLCIIGNSSCEPMALVTIANKSGTDKKIKVIYPREFEFPFSGRPYCSGSWDSLATFSLQGKERFSSVSTIPVITCDTVTRTYSFILKPNRGAMIEMKNFATLPTFGQIFIIDGKDTVVLKKHGKGFTKRPKLISGGRWTHIITDRK